MSRPDCPEIEAFARAYAAALLAGDEIAAEQVIREAIDADLSMAQVDDEIIAPSLWLIGDLWERGEISVAHEHLATEISLRVLALQREARRVAGARGAHAVMLAAPPGEQHTLALRMVADLLREAGYPVRLLGADVPADSLAAFAGRHRPSVICLSSTMPGGGDKVMITIHEVQKHWKGAGFVVGGRGLSPRLRSRPGLEVCERVSDVVDAVDAMVKRASMN